MPYSLRKSTMIWWQATRYHFVPPSLFPAIIATLVSWTSYDQFNLWYFFLVLLGLSLNHVALNMTDDYFDYKHAVDQYKNSEKNPYTGGSGTLTSGKIKPKKMFQIFSILYVFVIIIGLYLAYERGLMILFFGLVGVLCSIFYTAPPVKFAHHGFGELGLLINFGTTIGLGAFYVQTLMISWEAFFATLPCGVMLFSMIIINEIPDLEEDTLAGKLTLVARFGRRTGAQLYLISWSVTYLLIVGSVVSHILPWPILLGLISLPLTIKSIRILFKTSETPEKMIPANLSMIRAHALTSIGLISGYSIFGILQGKNSTNLFLMLLLFSFFYIPAVVPIIHKTK